MLFQKLTCEKQTTNIFSKLFIFFVCVFSYSYNIVIFGGIDGFPRKVSTVFSDKHSTRLSFLYTFVFHQSSKTALYCRLCILVQLPTTLPQHPWHSSKNLWRSLVSLLGKYFT